MSQFQFPTAWSYSRYADWEQCPLKYKFKYVDRLPTTQHPSAARGGVIHGELAAYCSGTTPLAPEIKGIEQRLIADEIRETPMTHKRVEEKWAFSSRWIGTSWMHNMTWLRVICDVVVWYDDNTAELVDWKTGKKYDSNNDQMEIFALSVGTKKSVDSVRTRLVYVDAGAQEIRDFPREEIESLRGKWGKIAETMLTDRQLPAQPNSMCRFCDFARSKGGQCRYG